MTELVTIFYSNYSGNCKALFQYLKNSNLMNSLSIKFINIDNSSIKEEILKKIDVVPAIVVIDNDQASLYSGENVFEWFYQFHSTLVAQPTATVESKNNLQSVEDQTNHKPTESQSNEPQNTKTKTIMEIAAEISKNRKKMDG
jgi:hypothetical protein